MPNPDDMTPPVHPMSKIDISDHPAITSPVAYSVLNYALANPVPATLEEEVAMHPESDRQRAVLVLTDCLVELARCEAEDAEPPEMMFFSPPQGGKVGKNGFMALFPDMPNSPVGRFRGNGMSCDLVETVTFIAKNFPDVMDQVSQAIADLSVDE